jgi:hypothetical protein
MQAMLGRADPLRVERRPNPAQVDAYLNEYILQKTPPRSSEHFELLQNYKEGASSTNCIIPTPIALNSRSSFYARSENPGCQLLVFVRI